MRRSSSELTCGARTRGGGAGGGATGGGGEAGGGGGVAGTGAGGVDGGTLATGGEGVDGIGGGVGVVGSAGGVNEGGGLLSSTATSDDRAGRGDGAGNAIVRTLAQPASARGTSHRGALAFTRPTAPAA
jgi:hypothetical protein